MSDPKYEKIGSRLTHLIEECAELIHILCKVERFGWHHYHPDDPNKVQNYYLVIKEMKDVEKRIIELRGLIREKIWVEPRFKIHNEHNYKEIVDALEFKKWLDNLIENGAVKLSAYFEYDRDGNIETISLERLEGRR